MDSLKNDLNEQEKLNKKAKKEHIDLKKLCEAEIHRLAVRTQHIGWYLKSD